MSKVDWESFLRQWSSEMLASSSGAEMPESVRANGWVGFGPASNDQISLAEKRLQIELPPSYKSFLRVSNGWLRVSSEIGGLFALERIDWFRKRHRQWISAYTDTAEVEADGQMPDEEYFAYGASAAAFKNAHLSASLQISEGEESAVYLLNPQVIAKDGEWEAWLFANWLPGAMRFRSFEELVQWEYSRFSGGEWSQHDGVVGELPDEYIGLPGSPKRRLKKRTRPKPRKVLGKPYVEWTAAELLELAKSPKFEIFSQAIMGLELLRAKEAIEPLLKMLPKGHNRANYAMHALKKLAPERLREPLLELLRRPERGAVFAAAGILAEFKEPRAIPLLMEIMQQTGPSAHRDAPYICKSIACFGSAGYEALASGLANADSVVRERAVTGLLYTNRPECRDLIKPLLKDAEESVRERAKSALKVLDS